MTKYKLYLPKRLKRQIALSLYYFFTESLANQLANTSIAPFELSSSLFDPAKDLADTYIAPIEPSDILFFSQPDINLN